MKGMNDDGGVAKRPTFILVEVAATVLAPFDISKTSPYLAADNLVIAAARRGDAER
jgi:hypothetical protein